MELVIIFILNVIVFILGTVLRLVLYSAKISLSLIKVPLGFGAKSALKSVLRGKKSPAISASALVAYISLSALIALLNLLIIIIDILFFLLSTFGILLGSVVALLILTVIMAGAYIIILNDCSIGGSSTTSATDSSSAKSDGSEAGSSESAGMGKLTEEAKSWAKTWEVTYIGDSLGAGSKSQFTSAFPKAVYDSDPSRGLISIKGQQTGETAIATLKRLIKENKVKSNLVVAIGTNNDISTEAIQQFYSEIPKEVKTITWVLTASEGGVDNASINSTIKNFVNSHDNMRYLDWKTYVDDNGGWNSYQGGDNIHMSSQGYSKYVDFQTQGLYDLYGKGSNSSGESSSESLSTANASDIRYINGIFQLAKNKVDEAVQAKVLADEEGNKKQGCNFSTSKVSDGSEGSNSNESSSGGNLEKDGTGSHGLNPTGNGLYYTRDTLPENLKKYAMDPESVGMKFGAPWEGGPSGPNSGGWVDFVGSFGAEWAGQCTELSASLIYQLWEKDGNHFLNTQGNGIDVTSFVSQKSGASITNTPKAGAVFSASYNHTGVVSHVFENGDILIIEQNTPHSGNSIGKPNTWNYRLISKSSLSYECGKGYVYLGDVGYKMSSNIKSMG